MNGLGNSILGFSILGCWVGFMGFERGWVDREGESAWMGAEWKEKDDSYTIEM